MIRRHIVRLVVIVAGLCGLVVWMLLSSTLGPPTPNAAGTFSFAALGDSPYDAFEARRYSFVLQDLAAHPLTSVVHVGDIFWEPCVDGRYAQTLQEFNALPHAVIYTPGDNEWTDCWEFGYAPLDRLAQIRRTFFDAPGRSLGGRPIALEHQGSGGAFAAHVENARWAQEGIVFATFHLVGSQNGMLPFSNRTEANDADAERRMAAAVVWLRETFAAARTADASGVVLAFHANPGFEEPPENPRRVVFEPFITALAEEVAVMGQPVLAVHGDWHDYTVDQPLTHRDTGEILANFTRVQVPGSPKVGWVRVTVAPGTAELFSFEPRVIPWWKGVFVAVEFFMQWWWAILLGMGLVVLVVVLVRRRNERRWAAWRAESS